MTMYFVVSVVALVVVLSALFPTAGQRLAEHLGIWSLIERIEGRHLRWFMAGLGAGLLGAMLIMVSAVLVGAVSSAWLVPAAQAGLFGGLLGWVSRSPRR